MSNQFNNRHKACFLVFGCITLLQCINGPSSIYQSSFSLFKQNYQISNLQLNYLIFAFEFGRLFMCIPGIASQYLPSWMILLVGIVCGSIGYGVQYVHMEYKTPCLSYWQVLVLNTLGGSSTCWIRTYCQLLSVKYFGNSGATVNAIASSYSGLNGKVYTSILVAFRNSRENDQNSITFLLSTCLVPAAVGLLTILVVNGCLKCAEYDNGDMGIMLPLVFVIAIVSGAYAIIETVVPTFACLSFQLRALILSFVVTVPFTVPFAITTYLFLKEKYHSCNPQEVSSGSIAKMIDNTIFITMHSEMEPERNGNVQKHLLMNQNFWLFFWSNACGATLGTVYQNNITGISVSRNTNEATLLVSISSAFEFFGRILSILLETYTREQKIPNSGLMVLMMIPMPAAFLLPLSGNTRSLYISTGILGTCSGALNVITSSMTSKLFGSNNLVLTQTLVQVNIPVATLLFGSLAAIDCDTNSEGNGKCVGSQCYYRAFIFWGFICIIGAMQSLVLHLRTHRQH